MRIKDLKTLRESTFICRLEATNDSTAFGTFAGVGQALPFAADENTVTQGHEHGIELA